MTRPRIRPATPAPLAAALLAAAILLVAPRAAGGQDLEPTPGPPDAPASAEPAPLPDPAAAEPLTVGVKLAPPFVMRTDDGVWHGISIELWDVVARGLGLEYQLVERDITGLIEGVGAKQGDEPARGGADLDVAIAALTITPEREAQLDFSHAYFESGLGVAAPRDARRGLWSSLGAVFTWEFIGALSSLCIILLVVGALVWVVERRANAEQFGGPILHGLGKGFWWSAVTMTTVGYGDKAPITLPGRLLGLVWMFTSIVIIASITGALASAFTVSQLADRIESADDLHNRRVAVVRDAFADDWLNARRVRTTPYDDLVQATAAVARGDADVVVHDRPLLLYQISADAEDLTVLPLQLTTDYYGIAFPTDSPLREPANVSMLRFLNDEAWRDLVYGYLGEE